MAFEPLNYTKSKSDTFYFTVGQNLSTLERPVLCEYNGLTFFPGEDIFQERIGCKVIDIKCNINGQITTSEYTHCDSTDPTTKVPGDSQSISTRSPKETGCLYENVLYSPGQEIYEGSYENWCFGAICSKDSEILRWDDKNCSRTGTREKKLPKLIPEATDELTTDGCVVDGIFYLPEERISKQLIEGQCSEMFCGPGNTVMKKEGNEC